MRSRIGAKTALAHLAHEDVHAPVMIEIRHAKRVRKVKVAIVEAMLLPLAFQRV
jgi:hypothetical protein